MKLRYFVIMTFSLFAVQLSAEELTQKEKLSYSFGQSIGDSLKQQNTDIDMDILMKGIADAMADKYTLLQADQIEETLGTFRKEKLAEQAKKRQQLTEKNAQKGEAFLAENKKKEGVIALPSGLQYKILRPGSGRQPGPTDTVTTHYRGTLIDGTEFDSSYARNKPSSFAVNRVIQGWTEALQLMKEGAKWKLFIPSDLAYGKRGAAGGKIGPNETLIFEVELLSVDTVDEEESAKTLE